MVRQRAKRSIFGGRHLHSPLEHYLFAATNILRGPVGAANFKTYVFPLLFFKSSSHADGEEAHKPSRRLKEHAA